MATTATALKAWRTARAKYKYDEDRGAAWTLECARSVDLALERLEYIVGDELQEVIGSVSDRTVRTVVEDIIGEPVKWLAE